MMTERFIVGVAGPPFGLKGHIRVQSLSGETGHLLALRSVTLRRGGGEEIREIEESVPSFSAAKRPAGVLMKFRGIDSPEAAKALGGAELVCGRDQASPLKPNEYYVEDLKGLAVILEAGNAETGEALREEEILGHIAGIVEGGGGLLAELVLASGEKRLVPFKNEFFGDIDIQNRRAVLLNRWILE
jgi:16S rRNA processing protein RimM